MILDWADIGVVIQISSHRLLNPIKILKYLYFRKKLTFIRTRYRQNQHLWRHFGDTMSPENQGVFQLLKEMTLRLTGASGIITVEVCRSA